MPYREDFNLRDYEVNADDGFNYCGAGLLAYQTLLAERGYRLVGANRTGYNAFFVKATEAGTALPEVTVASCMQSEWNKWGQVHRFAKVAEMDWTDITQM